MTSRRYISIFCLVWVFTTLTTLMGSGLYADAGLLDGDQYTASYLTGRPTVVCKNSTNSPNSTDPAAASLPQKRVIFCDYTYLAPAEKSRFFTTSGVSADTLVLSSMSASGDLTTVVAEFDPTTGQTRNDLNLWSWLLLKRPLLRQGEDNHHLLAYHLYLGQDLVEEGEFQVEVTMGPPRYCRPRIMLSADGYDCQHTKFICRRYFQEENYCQY